MDKVDFPETKSHPLNEEAAPGTPEALHPYVDNGGGIISPERNFDPQIAHEEWEKLWCRVWQLAGLASDIPEVGDYFKYDVGPESFIITRTGPGEEDIAAYYNVCQHRGNRLVMDDFGSVDHFTCLFHTWQWNLDGSLKQITDRETFRENLVADNPPLTQARCEIWDGFVFINMDDDAEPLLDFLDPLPEHLKAYNFKDMKIIKDLQTPWPCNWKIGHDAFIEVYHVHAVHPEILPFFNDYQVQWDTYRAGHSRQLLKFGEISHRFEDQESINPGLAALLEEVNVAPEDFPDNPDDSRRLIQEAKRAKAERLGLDYSGFTDNQLSDDWNYGIFPNVTFNAHPEGLLIQRFRPHAKDPEKMTYDLMVLFNPVDDPTYRVPAYMGVEDDVDISGKVRPERRFIGHGEPGLGDVISQDARMMEYVQQGINSRGYGGARYSEMEQQLRHWHREWERYMDGER
jgi:phenylpropionate dioxygenase-like ring-hydroxylating dioxygenase large terminal subunit